MSIFRQNRKLMFNFLVIVLLCIAFVYIFFIGIKNIFRYNVFLQEQKNLQEVYVNEVELNHEYTAQILAMENPYYWEFQARKKLGYKKKDEIVYKFVYKLHNWR